MSTKKRKRNSFTSITKVRLPLRRLSGKSQTLNKLLLTSSVPIFFLSYRKFRQYWKNFTAPLSKVRLSLGRFSNNTQLLNGTAWKFTIPSFIQIGQEILDVPAENNVCPKKSMNVRELDIVRSQTNSILLNLEKFKIYIKIHINIAPTCFGLPPSSGSLYRAWLKLFFY